MNKQFTASEVRSAIGALEARDMEYEAGMLRAFADLLEVQERAVPVVTRESAINAIEHVGRYNGPGRETEACQMLVEGSPSVAHRAPSDAKRLAEALRCALTWIGVAPHADSCGDADAYNHTELRSCGCGKDAIVENLTEAFAVHSAQAQPPAASVTDAIARRMVAEYDAVLCGDPTATRTDGMRAALEAALATHENPNG